MAFPAPLTCAQVLQRYTRGPKSGLFTDGSVQPNPGPGGWGCVYVDNDDVRFLDGLGTATPDGAQISIIPAVAGG